MSYEMYDAKIITDSLATDTGYRLTTMETTFPRFILSEFNTHRVFSRNSASSRAIPFEKQLVKIINMPFSPIHWGVNQPGMQAFQELDDTNQQIAQEIWLESRNSQVAHAVKLAGGPEILKDEALKEQAEILIGRYVINKELPDVNPGIHKQIVNRLLEPYMWHTAIVTSTDWENFYALRTHPDAQPEIQEAADKMLEAHLESVPNNIRESEWHLPLIQPDEQEWAQENVRDAIKVAIGRCARVSYLTQDGIRDKSKDIELYERLVSSGHMSPTEHVATPMAASHCRAFPNNLYSGNFKGWIQFRKQISNENNYASVRNLKFIDITEKE